MQAITERLPRVDVEVMRRHLFTLSHDWIQRRTLNSVAPGHWQNTLYDTDDYLAAQLQSWGYIVERQPAPVRAFGRNLTKPLSQQYDTPPAGSPWLTGYTVMGLRPALTRGHDLLVVLAHKDSQSWIASPGANDNAIGTVGVLEVARVLADYQPQHDLMFLWCNEEHTPWNSVVAAETVRDTGWDVLTALNLDGIGVKAPAQAGQMTNVTRYCTPEGDRLADLTAALNIEYGLGLQTTKFYSERTGDDDGSFINAGFPWTVLNIGSLPYGDPNYHAPEDVAELVDVENAAKAVQLTLATLLHVDIQGRP